MYLQLDPQVRIEEKEDAIALLSPVGTLTWNRPSNAFRLFAANLSGYISACLEHEEVEIYFLIEILKKHGLLHFTCMQDKNPILTLHAMKPPLYLEDNIDYDARMFKLSRFAAIRSFNGQMILETPLSSGRIVIKDQLGARLLQILVNPCTFQELCNQFPSETTLKECLQLLISAKAIADSDTEDHDPILGQWEFHDLLFHARSRTGRHNYPYGGNYPYKNRFPPLPALKSVPSKRTIPLFKPDLERLKKEDMILTEAIERRKSIRKQGQLPIHANQLGEFLYRVARVKEVELRGPQEIAKRPYPCGGALYEHELYLIIHACQEIETGLYHYDPLRHELGFISSPTNKTEQLLQDSSSASEMQAFPQVLIIISARFQRRSWKYQSIAYATSLKNAGVLLQTMYLVATAMGLAPCAIGGGNSDLFAEAIGSNYFEETSICEFKLGSQCLTN